MQVPWAAPQGRFTLLFERFAVEVLLASGSISQACELLGINWQTAQEIMARAVERGLERRPSARSAAGSVRFMIARRSAPGGIWTRCSSPR